MTHDPSSWQPIDLSDLEPRDRITPGIGGLLYKGARHGFVGESEGAKTTAAYALALETIRAGNWPVLILDFEMGEYGAVERLRDMGATTEELKPDRVVFVHPEQRSAAGEIDALLALKPTLAIIDAAAGAYSVLGLDDGKRQDVETFARLMVDPFWKAGVTSIGIDHVVKSKDNRTRYAIGSERKLGAVDVSLGFEATTPFRRGRNSLVKITVHKDRFGHLPRPRAADLELRSDPETHAITWTFRPARIDDTEPEAVFRPTELMERSSRWLEQQAEPVSRNKVETNVSGNDKYIRVALDILTAEQYISETKGDRSARLVDSARPYRQADDPPRPTSAHLGSTSAETEVIDFGHRFPPLRGDEAEVEPTPTDIDFGHQNGRDASDGATRAQESFEVLV